MRFNVPETIELVALLPPAADAAGRTSTVFANLRGYVRAALVFYVNQGNAATITVTPRQGNTAGGGGAKAMPEMQIYTALAAQSSPLVWTRQTAATSFTTDNATTTKYVIFDIEPTRMDTDNGFHYLGITTGASNVANITSAFVIGQRKYDGTVTINPLA